jgi:hypothetical protein
MPKHFPSWRTQVSMLLTISLLAFVARHRLDGCQDQYRPIPPEKPLVGPAQQVITSGAPVTLPAPKRTPPAASFLSRLLSLMAEDPTFARGETRMMKHGGSPMSYHHMNIQGNAIATKAMPVPPMVEVPAVPLATGDHYSPEAEAVFFVEQWLRSRAATHRAELTGLVHRSELTVLDMIAKLKGQSLAHREALTAFWFSYRDVSRASTRVAELAAFDALAAVAGKSIVLDGKEYVADTSRCKVGVRSVTKGKTVSNDP